MGCRARFLAGTLEQPSSPGTAQTVHWPWNALSMPGFARLKRMVPARRSCGDPGVAMTNVGQQVQTPVLLGVVAVTCIFETLHWLGGQACPNGVADGGQTHSLLMND